MLEHILLRGLDAVTPLKQRVLEQLQGLRAGGQLGQGEIDEIAQRVLAALGQARDEAQRKLEAGGGALSEVVQLWLRDGLKLATRDDVESLRGELAALRQALAQRPPPGPTSG